MTPPDIKVSRVSLFLKAFGALIHAEKRGFFLPDQRSSLSRLNLGPILVGLHHLILAQYSVSEKAIRFAGTCAGKAMSSNGYIELTGYAESLPLP